MIQRACLALFVVGASCSSEPPSSKVSESEPLVANNAAIVRAANEVWRFPKVVDDRGRTLGDHQIIEAPSGEAVATQEGVYELQTTGGMHATFRDDSFIGLRRGAIEIAIESDNTKFAAGQGYLTSNTTRGKSIYRPTPDGFEDYHFIDRPSDHVHYTVRLVSVVGVRFVAQTLEFLDRQGSPQLRMIAPTIYDARGPHAVAMNVTRCAYDADPSAPWGRPVTTPRSETCDVDLSWRDVVYPAVLDPAWMATGSMATARFYHASSVVTSPPRILVSGGFDTAGNALASCELFDGVTFAATGAMHTARGNHGQALLSSGKHLVAGGRVAANTPPSPALPTSEEYDPIAGTWTVTGPMPSPVYASAFTPIRAGSRVISAGGWQSGNATSAIQVYNQTLHTWSLSSATLSQARAFLASAVLPTPPAPNMFLVVGGEFLDGGLITPVNNVDVYNLDTDTAWAAAPFPGARSHAAGAALIGVNGGHSHPWAVVAGGSEGAATYHDVYVFDLTGASSLPLGGLGSWTGSITPTNAMSIERQDFTATLLTSAGKTNHVVFAGGFHWVGFSQVTNTTSDEIDLSALAPPYAWTAPCSGVGRYNCPMFNGRWAQTAQNMMNIVFTNGGIGTTATPISSSEQYN